MTTGLRRDLGTLESYAALLGMLIGAGIFKVTSEAWALTGPSVILGYVVLAPAILATSVAYSVFLSTPLGCDPGGEYTHFSRTFGGYGLAFIGAWLKTCSYIGALTYLASALGDYIVAMFGGRIPASAAVPLAIACLLFFYGINVAGVRWFGRIQVWMCTLLGLSIVALVVPGLFHIRFENYRPFFTHGIGGFAASLPPLFFAYAGFEGLAQTAGEVRDSTHRLPQIFLRGILITTIIYFLMSVVALGVLPGEQLRASDAPMTTVASRYLAGAAWFVTLGAIMAIATSVNATMIVPSRIAIMLADDGLAPRAIASIWPRTGTPVLGLTITTAVSIALLLSGKLLLVLSIAVFALVAVYFLHSIALLLLPRANPQLFASVTLRMPRSMQIIAAWISILSMGTILAVMLRDLALIKLLAFWAAVGGVLYAIRRSTALRSSSPR